MKMNSSPQMSLTGLSVRGQNDTMHNQEETTAGLTGNTELSTEIIKPVPKSRPWKPGKKAWKNNDPHRHTRKSQIVNKSAKRSQIVHSGTTFDQETINKSLFTANSFEEKTE